MYRQKSPVYTSLCFLAICIVLSSFFSACSGSGSNAQNSGNSGDTNALPPGTGGISFQLVMQPASGSGAHILTPAFNSCADYALGTIAATVTSGTATVTSNSWPCALHQGVILGVPAGSNYTVQVKGLSSGPTMTTIWSGQAPSITVITGQVTNAGTITMSYVGGNSTVPTVTLIGPNSNPASTTNVPVTDRIDIVFSQPMAISTVTSTNITLNDGSPVAGTVSYDSASDTAAFIPSAPLSYGTQYVLQVMSCVTGSCINATTGVTMASNYTNTITTESAPTGTANAPTGLTATPGNGQVTLDWLAENGARSYNVYYSTSPGVTTATGTQIPVAGCPRCTPGSYQRHDLLLHRHRRQHLRRVSGLRPVKHDTRLPNGESVAAREPRG